MNRRTYCAAIVFPVVSKPCGWDRHLDQGRERRRAGPGRVGSEAAVLFIMSLQPTLCCACLNTPPSRFVIAIPQGSRLKRAQQSRTRPFHSQLKKSHVSWFVAINQAISISEDQSRTLCCGYLCVIVWCDVTDSRLCTNRRDDNRRVDDCSLAEQRKKSRRLKLGQFHWSTSVACVRVRVRVHESRCVLKCIDLRSA